MITATLLGLIPRSSGQTDADPRDQSPAGRPLTLESNPRPTGSGLTPWAADFLGAVHVSSIIAHPRSRRR